MANAMRHPLAAVKQFSQAPVANTAASEPAGEAGSVAEAVREQIDGLGGIAKERPGLVAGADVLAQALDNPRAQPHHAAIAEQLVKILGELSKGARRRGRPAAVRSMT